MTVDIRKKVSDAFIYLYTKEHFIATFAKLTKIIIVNVDDNRKIAWTNGKDIFISRHAVTTYSTRDLAFILAHEAMHMIMMHIPRMKTLLKKYSHMIINVAADALVHEIIHSLVTDEFKEKIVTCDKLPNSAKKRCKEMASLEELTELLHRELSSITDIGDIGGIGEDLSENGGSGESGDGEVVNEGDGEGDGESKGGGEREGDEVIVRRLLKAHAISKLAGRVPAWADRIVNELLKPKVDWRILLRNALTVNAKKVRRTWSRPSRKIPEAPGKVLYGAKILILLDTSGSITNDILSMFMSEVYAVAREAEITLVPWDAVAYQPVKIRRPNDVRKVELKGGGGTMIKPVLLFATKNANFDVIIIMSDWHVGDLHDDDVVRMLARMRHKIIAVTVDAEPPPFLRRIRIPTS